jgi:hypothetical protein
MATEEQLIEARNNALNAGRNDDARKLADALAEMQGLPSRSSIRQPLEDFVFEQDPEEGGFETAAKSGVAGFANAFAEPLYGASDLMGLGDYVDSDAKLANLQNLQDRSSVGAGTKLVGDIAKYSVPGTAALKVAANSGKALPYIIAGAESLGSGLIKSLESPEEGDTRLGNASEEAAYALAGSGAGEVLKKTLKGINLKEGARKYLDQGGYLTPGQASDNKSIRYLESFMGVLPVTSRRTEDLQEQALQEYSPNVVQQLTQGLDETLSMLPKTGERATQKAMTQLGQTVDNLYEDAWGSVSQPSLMNWFTGGKNNYLDKISKKSELYSTPEETGALKRIALSVNDGIGKADTKIRNAMENAEGDFLETLTELRAELRSHAGPEVIQKLNHVDSFYPEVLAARRAASKKDFGTFTPREHAASTRTVGGTRRASEGRAPGQQDAENLSAIMAPQSIGLVKDIGRATRANPINIPFMEQIGNSLIGNTKLQRLGREQLKNEDLINQLRAFSGASGAAYFGD